MTIFEGKIAQYIMLGKSIFIVGIPNFIILYFKGYIFKLSVKSFCSISTLCFLKKGNIWALIGIATIVITCFCKITIKTYAKTLTTQSTFHFFKHYLVHSYLTGSSVTSPFMFFDICCPTLNQQHVLYKPSLTMSILTWSNRSWPGEVNTTCLIEWTECL